MISLIKAAAFLAMTIDSVKNGAKLRYSTEKYEKIRTESTFEQEVYEHLLGRGFRVDKQVRAGRYRKDLAVRHPLRRGQYILGIECDGYTYHSAPHQRRRDGNRQRELERRGWTILRVGSRYWWRDRRGQTDRIVNTVLRELIRNIDMPRHHY